MSISNLQQTILNDAKAVASAVTASVLPNGATKIMVNAGNEKVELHLSNNFAQIQYNEQLPTQVAANASTRGLNLLAAALISNPLTVDQNAIISRSLGFARNFSRPQTQLA